MLNIFLATFVDFMEHGILCVIVGSLLSVDFIDVNIRDLKITIFGSSIKIK